MQTVSLKRVTIVAESLLESRLIDDLGRLGARGWTALDARGSGSRGLRTSEWEGKNVRIETIDSPAVAERILAHVAEHYFAHFAVIAYVDVVDVVGGDKHA